MGIKLARKKKRDLLVSFVYRAQKLLPVNKKRKFRLFLKLEWIFDRLAHEISFQNYDSSNHPLRMHSIKFMLDNINHDSVILDLGCKEGEISGFLANKARHVIGIDHNVEFIQKAKAANARKNIEYIAQDAFVYLKESKIKFDVLILSHILEHIDGPEKFLNDVKTAFKYIYIEVPDFDKTYLNHYRQDLKMDLIYTDDDHVSEFDRNEIRKMLDDCRLEIIAEEYKFGVMKIWCKTGF